jgi:uncharacterized Zn finger protein
MGEKPYFSQERLEECVDGNNEFEKCPECDEEFDTSQGVAMHYGYNHEGSIGYLFRCEECGRLDFGYGQTDRFCSKWCEVHNKTGTFKHFDEDYLREQIESGNTVTEIAKDLGVGMKTISKWVLEYNIGDGYECPSCERHFASKQGVSKHHKDKHGESISGTTYTCRYCGEENWTRKSEDNHKYPEYCDDDCFGADMEGEDNPNKQKERKEKISQGLVDAYAEGRRKPGHRKQIEVEETGNIVDSSWEKEVDILLNDSQYNYFYNGHGEYNRYEIGEFTHAPDFVIPTVVGEIIIEVKGGSVMFFQGDKMEEIGREFTERNDVEYIVYGDVDIKCDYHIDYGNESKLLETIQSIV